MSFKSTVYLLVLFFIIGCAGKQVRKSDKKWMEERLVKRIDEFQTNYLSNKPENVRPIMLGEKKKGLDGIGINPNYLAKDNHMSKYYEAKYEIVGIEMREKKAKVKISYFVQDRKDADIMEAGVYDFWAFEDDDWYFAFGGKDEFYKAEGWW